MLVTVTPLWSTGTGAPPSGATGLIGASSNRFRADFLGLRRSACSRPTPFAVALDGDFVLRREATLHTSVVDVHEFVTVLSDESGPSEEESVRAAGGSIGKERRFSLLAGRQQVKASTRRRFSA
jgi:hypothetical protein